MTGNPMKKSRRSGAIQAIQLTAALSFGLAGLLPAVLAHGQDAGSAGGTLATSGVDIGLLPHDLSPWSMFLEADIVVKAVMISLAIASIVTWTVLVAKTMELAAHKHQAHVSLSVLGAARTLNEAAQQFEKRAGDVAALVAAAVAEANVSADVPG